MMMMMMTLENVVDDDDVMTTTAKQCSSKISKKKKRTTLLFLMVYQRGVLLRHSVFLRLSVCLFVCNQNVSRALLFKVQVCGLFGENYFIQNVPFFFIFSNIKGKTHVIQDTKKERKKKKNGEKGIRGGEKEEEEGERRGREGGREGNGAVETRSDQVVDGVGDAP